VRDHIQPEKDLGHSDKHGKLGKAVKDEAERGEEEAEEVVSVTKEQGKEKKLEDCATCA